MSIVKMKKLSLAIHDSSREDLIMRLQKAGCVHIDGKESVSDADLRSVEIFDDEIDSQVSDLEDVIAFLEDFLPPRKIGLLDSLGAVLPRMSFSEMEKVYGSFDFVPVLKDIKTIEKRLKDAENRYFNLVKEREDLKQWQQSEKQGDADSIEIDLDIINGRNPLLGGIAAYVTASDYEDLKQKLKEVSELADIFPVFTEGTDVYLYLIYHKSEEEKVRDLIKNFALALVSVSNRNGTVRENLDRIEREISDLEHEIEVQKMFIVDYQEYLDDLKIVYDYLSIRQERLKAEAEGVKTQTVTFYTAWVPEDRLEDLKALLSDFPDAEYSLEDPLPEEYEEVPVKLNIPSSAKAFEPITRMFGMPAYGKTLDPTIHLAPFYFLFYGFCLSDFMYGLVMFVLFGFLSMKSRKNPANYYFMKLFSLAGLSSMIFGLVFGSFFGDLFTNPQFLYIEPLSKVGLINTLEKPMVVLYLALIFGAIQLIYGVFLHLVVQARESLAEALWDNIPWILLLTGGFGWAVFFWIAGMAKVDLPPAKVQTILLFTALLGVILILLNSMRKGASKGVLGVVGGFFGGLWEIYGATGYLSDLLSYARLLALGLSTGVIAGVFNFLAFGMLMKGGSVIGIFFGIVLLVFGHTFNLVLSAFGAFVHALRLQFVEFFSKFMEGGGKEFKPLKENGYYYQTDKE